MPDQPTNPTNPTNPADPADPADLEARLDRWTRDTAAAEPRLRPHLEELADHLRSDVGTRLAGGANLDTAFAAAVTALGTPTELSREYAKVERLPARLFGWLADERHETRGDLTLAAAWIGMSLIWAATAALGPIVGFELAVNWMIVGWAATTFGPLTALDVALRRTRAAREKAR